MSLAWLIKSKPELPTAECGHVPSINLALLRSLYSSQRTWLRLARPMASASSPSPNLPLLPSVPGTEPSKCVLDSFRTAIAKRVSDALPPLTIEQAYAGVDYGKKGVDFTVALPRFRLPGKVDELAGKVVSNVSTHRSDGRRDRIRYYVLFLTTYTFCF